MPLLIAILKPIIRFLNANSLLILSAVFCLETESFQQSGKLW